MKCDPQDVGSPIISYTHQGEIFGDPYPIILDQVDEIGLVENDENTMISWQKPWFLAEQTHPMIFC